MNLYAFVGNNGVNRWDFLGLRSLIPRCFSKFVYAVASVVAATEKSVDLGMKEIQQAAKNIKYDDNGLFVKQGEHSFFSATMTMRELTIQGQKRVIENYNSIVGREYWSFVYCCKSTGCGYTEPEKGEAPTYEEYKDGKFGGRYFRVTIAAKQELEKGGDCKALAFVHSHNVRHVSQLPGQEQTVVPYDNAHVLSESDIDLGRILGVPVCAATEDSIDCR